MTNPEILTVSGESTAVASAVVAIVSQHTRAPGSDGTIIIVLIESAGELGIAPLFLIVGHNDQAKESTNRKTNERTDFNQTWPCAVKDWANLIGKNNGRWGEEEEDLLRPAEGKWRVSFGRR